MHPTNVLPKIITGLVLLLVPGAIGWLAGQRGRGKRFVRVCAGLALLFAGAGVYLIVATEISLTTPPSARGNGFGYVIFGYVVGGLLLAVAVLAATVACGLALAQTHANGRRGWLLAVALAAGVPLVLSVTCFTLNLLHVPSSAPYLVISVIFGALSVLGVVAYALFGLKEGAPHEAPLSTRAH